MELSNQLPGSHPLTAPVLLPERVTGPPEVHPSEGRCPTGPTAVAPAESRGDRPLDKADRRLDSAGPRPVGQTAYLAQGMTGRDAVFCGDVREQGAGAFLLAAHQLRANTSFYRGWLAFSAAS
jgi:hypothetical protein